MAVCATKGLGAGRTRAWLLDDACSKAASVAFFGFCLGWAGAAEPVTL